VIMTARAARMSARSSRSLSGVKGLLASGVMAAATAAALGAVAQMRLAVNSWGSSAVGLR
jgi:hypothetical protein